MKLDSDRQQCRCRGAQGCVHTEGTCAPLRAAELNGVPLKLGRALAPSRKFGERLAPCDSNSVTELRASLLRADFRTNLATRASFIQLDAVVRRPRGQIVRHIFGEEIGIAQKGIPLSTRFLIPIPI